MLLEFNSIPNPYNQQLSKTSAIHQLLLTHSYYTVVVVVNRNVVVIVIVVSVIVHVESSCLFLLNINRRSRS